MQPCVSVVPIIGLAYIQAAMLLQGLFQDDYLITCMNAGRLWIKLVDTFSGTKLLIWQNVHMSKQPWDLSNSQPRPTHHMNHFVPLIAGASNQESCVGQGAKAE